MAAMTDVPSIGAATRSPASGIDADKLRFLEEMTTNVDAVQERVLAEILARNGEAEYLVKCGLAAGATDRATFRDQVPLVAYEDLQPYIRRIADGDRSPILTGQGTPSPSSSQAPYVSGLDKGSGLHFLFVKSETKTQGGLPARTTLSSYHRSDQFKNSYHNYTSPMAAILCADEFQSMYTQMLCGLCQRHRVLHVGAAFAYGLLLALRFLQHNWEQLAADIEAGTLNSRVTDPSVRGAVAGILKPDPELAQFIRAECSKGDWAGIIMRIWPNTRYLFVAATGSMAQYISTLDFYSGGLPIISTVYGSSECYFGLNLRPMCDPSEVSYTIMPNMGYFEFLPVDSADAATSNQLVELAGVEAGREYELVVTTYTGLNRYRVGDVLQVTGFHNAAPQFRFVRRGNAVLSIDSDKTDEDELQRAVRRASTLLRSHGAAVSDYTSRACTESIPGHYVIYWELLTTKAPHGLEGNILDGCCLEMEEALSSVYRQKRVVEGSIGPLEIRVVQSGTFQELMEYAISRGTSIGQYKVPRCVTVPSIIELLDSRVVSSHFSSLASPL
ncbi:hypothetical protein ACP70R_038469 [Stipagrostis hirtigluma subsp. patula]